MTKLFSSFWTEFHILENNNISLHLDTLHSNGPHASKETCNINPKQKGFDLLMHALITIIMVLHATYVYSILQQLTFRHLYQVI